MGRERRGSLNSRLTTVKVTGHWPRRGGGGHARAGSAEGRHRMAPCGLLDVSPYLQSTETCGRQIASLWAPRVKETGSCSKGAYSLMEWIRGARKAVGNQARS